eukprot:6478354-Amphidinium_carterae.1
MQEAMILSYTPPLAPQRTNVHSDKYPVRSQAFGLHTTRGTGVTKATFTHLALMHHIHTLAAARDPEHQLPYYAIQASMDSQLTETAATPSTPAMYLQWDSTQEGNCG